ncbi:MAG TPA: hypothetical protein VKB46_05115 [Pyrinomonadaceae bacterium]|nr:hypothetical protein [Pyrinomonadaceae bacterium]
MSTQKRLSHLSIAAAALLTVAVPTFAQTKSADSANELTSTRTVVAFNSERLANPFDSLNRTSERAGSVATSDSPAQPKLMASQFSINENNLGLTKPQSKSYEIRFDVNNQVSTDNQGGSVAKGISFVPSRGPKYPW